MPDASAEIAAKLRKAMALWRDARPRDAERVCLEILEQAPKHLDTMHLLGVIEARRGAFEAALERIGLVTQLRPDNAAAHSDLGGVLRSLGRNADALESYDRALAITPHYPQALRNRGNTLRALRRFEEAVADFERALALQPDSALTLYYRGAALQALNREDEALESYERALRLKSDFPEALNDRGNVLRTMRRLDAALASFDRALALDPAYAEAHNNRGNVLHDMGRHLEALESYDSALALNANQAGTLYNRGLALDSLRRYEEAAACYERVLAAAPDYPLAKGRLHYARIRCCDWSQFAQLSQSIDDGIREGKSAAEPFVYQAISASPPDLRRCAEIYAAERFTVAAAPSRTRARDETRIRLGYVSGEFREHATAMLTVGLFEHHDRRRFRLFAFDSGWDDGSAVRARIDRAFDEVVDVSGAGDREAATMIRNRDIDILIDLNGYFGRARQGIFCHRPSPLQVNYLGFPGTLGLSCYDYILADRHVIPPEHRAFYAENVVYLPDSYQANDASRSIAELTPARADASLPDEAFVFCCFNNSYKIAPAVFDLWMRLLVNVPGSVLWLLDHDGAACRNLRREAVQRGVAPERLIFAPRLDPAEHLARHRLADLFLDTLPYNAHTTASDALWAGLPVLTCTGSAFAGRVAGSLLNALGMPELITRSLEEYERTAVGLARSPAKLRAIREKLAGHRSTHALFDTGLFCRHIEAAYAAMWSRHERGEPPAPFAV